MIRAFRKRRQGSPAQKSGLRFSLRGNDERIAREDEKIIRNGFPGRRDASAGFATVVITLRMMTSIAGRYPCAGPGGYSASARQSTAALLLLRAGAIRAAKRLYRSATFGAPGRPGCRYDAGRRPMPGAVPLPAARPGKASARHPIASRSRRTGRSTAA